MHSPQTELPAQSSVFSCDTSADAHNNNNLERLKQQSQHCNGNSVNTHFISISTQTNHSPLTTQTFTNSQKEVLRLIGQHLQSAGLRYFSTAKNFFVHASLFRSSQTLESLISESGCVLEHEQASNFRELVIAGKWTDVPAFEIDLLFVHCFVLFQAVIALDPLKEYIEERNGIQVKFSTISLADFSSEYLSLANEIFNSGTKILRINRR